MIKPRKLTQQEEAWYDNCDAAKEAIEKMLEVQQDYQAIFDELTERQQESARGEAIQRILDLQLEDALGYINEAFESELP